MNHTIYTITNLVTGRTYYGTTSNYKDRVGTHRKYLEVHERHPNLELQEDWTKLGSGEFQFDIMESGVSKEYAATQEKRLIAADPGCYNVRLNASKPKSFSKKFISYKDRAFIQSHKGQGCGYKLAELFGVSESKISQIMNMPPYSMYGL